MGDGTAGQGGGFQQRDRMRIPQIMLEVTYQMHVVEAIRRNREIDEDDLYGRALADLTQGDDLAVFTDLSDLITGVTSGRLKGQEIDAAARVMHGAERLGHDDDYASITEFDNRFLNGRGRGALLTILMMRDAAKLDLDAIDRFRGGEALLAAYGPRRTRPQKRLGVGLQTILKQLPTVDEPATMEAADRYVEYRFLDHGSLPGYKRRRELEGDSPSDRYLRKWFRKFDRALGYPPPPPGRPPNRRGQRQQAATQ